MDVASGGAGVEWIGGVRPVPARVAGEDEPFTPEGLFWLGSDGAVVGMELARPGTLLAVAASHLASTIDRARLSDTPVPARVRVSSKELADALGQQAIPVEIVCAPTPELDALMLAMARRMGGKRPTSCSTRPGARARRPSARSSRRRRRCTAPARGRPCPRTRPSP